jgi:hypothetical protein
MEGGDATMTNQRWYPYEALGNYFRLVDDALLAVPMRQDGSMEMDGSEPNAVQVIDTADAARIARELRTKP